MAKADGRFALLQTLAAAPMRLGLASVVIGWLMIAAPCMAMPGEPDPQREVCRRVAMSPEEYRALADEIRGLPPEAVRGEDQESRVTALLRERLEQILAGRGNADQQSAMILGLIRTVEADVGLPTLEPARRDQILAWLTLGLLAEECGDTQPSVEFEQADQDACRIGAVSPEQYQAIAAEIASQPATDWREIHRGATDSRNSDAEEALEAALRDRIQEVMASRGSADQKIAAMHALMRSLGAEFMWIDLVRLYRDPGLHWGAGYHYRIDVNRLGVSRLWRPWGRIDVVFFTDEAHQTLSNWSRVVVHIPVPFLTGVTGRKERLRQIYACPQIPAETELPPWHPRRQQRE